MSEKWKDNLIKITPYVAGEQSKSPDLIKLNANENAYPPSPKVAEAINNFDVSKLRLYPDSNCEPLKSVLAEYYNLNKDQIFVGNGSDDVLATSFRAFFNSDKPIFYPDVTYSFYPVWCELLNIKYKTIPLDENYRINPEDYKAENGGVIFPNPNAPTSISLSKQDVKKILDENSDVIVIIDETYVDFGGESVIDLLPEYPNLVITRTFSKSRSLAGMRLGFAFASAELVSYMNAVKDSYNSYPLDSVSLAAGTASVKDDEYFRKITAKIIKTREETKLALEQKNFTVLPSSTNFLFAKPSDKSAEEIFEFLKSKDIFVRHFSGERTHEWLRITIGTDEQMKKLLELI